MPIAYIASMYAAHSRRPADCLPDFYPTRGAAIAAAQEEIMRVAAMPVELREHTIDWAVRYTVRKVRFHV